MEAATAGFELATTALVVMPSCETVAFDYVLAGTGRVNFLQVDPVAVAASNNPLLTTLVALLASSASPAAAQVIAEGGGTGVVSSGPTQQWRLNAYGVLRGGGDWRGRTNGPDFNSDMRVGGGVGLRMEIPIHKYVVLGPMVDYHLLNPDDILGFDPDKVWVTVLDVAPGSATVKVVGMFEDCRKPKTVPVVGWRFTTGAYDPAKAAAR